MSQTHSYVSALTNISIKKTKFGFSNSNSGGIKIACKLLIFTKNTNRLLNIGCSDGLELDFFYMFKNDHCVGSRHFSFFSASRHIWGYELKNAFGMCVQNEPDGVLAWWLIRNWYSWLFQKVCLQNITCTFEQTTCDIYLLIPGGDTRDGHPDYRHLCMQILQPKCAK